MTFDSFPMCILVAYQGNHAAVHKRWMLILIQRQRQQMVVADLSERKRADV